MRANVALNNWVSRSKGAGAGVDCVRLLSAGALGLTRLSRLSQMGAVPRVLAERLNPIADENFRNGSGRGSTKEATAAVGPYLSCRL